MRPRSRTGRRGGLLAAVALGSVAATAAACGGGTASPGAAGPATASQTATAHALNLASSDLPQGWQRQSQGTGPNVVRNAFDTCLARSPGVATPVASADSANYLDLTTGQEVASQARIYGSPAEATSAAREAGGSATSGCMQHAVATDLPGTLPSGESVEHVTVTTQPAGRRWTFGQRVTVQLAYPLSGGTTGGSTVFLDVLGFARGAALVTAELESTGSPPPASLERSTMAALQKRAAAA